MAPADNVYYVALSSCNSNASSHCPAGIRGSRKAQNLLSMTAGSFYCCFLSAWDSVWHIGDSPSTCWMDGWMGGPMNSDQPYLERHPCRTILVIPPPQSDQKPSTKGRPAGVAQDLEQSSSLQAQHRHLRQPFPQKREQMSSSLGQVASLTPLGSLELRCRLPATPFTRRAVTPPARARLPPPFE